MKNDPPPAQPEESCLNLPFIRQRIEEMDLSPLEDRLVAENGWPRELARDMGRVYREMLFVVAQYPILGLAPAEPLEEMWRVHMSGG